MADKLTKNETEKFQEKKSLNDLNNLLKSLNSEYIELSKELKDIESKRKDDLKVKENI